MKHKPQVARSRALRGSGGVFKRLVLKIRRVLSRLTGRSAKKNPNIYPLY